MPAYDVVGLGLNATDTLILLSGFPAYAGKMAFTSEQLSPGGQVASALVTCACLGLRAKYVGTVGDDERGQIQRRSLLDLGINLDDLQVRANCPNQTAYILIDQTSGERTVLWNRPECLRMRPEDITEQQITCARLLHIDGCDVAAAAKAARIAREHDTPVTLDVDTIYPDFERVLPFVDYLIASSEFPSQWTREADPLRALIKIQEEYGMFLAATTLGAHGAIARVGGRFFYSPGYRVTCADTTGAGDVFHGAFCYAVLQSLPIPDALDFSNAMAALNCTERGARGGIKSAAEAKLLMARADRCSQSSLEPYRVTS